MPEEHEPPYSWRDRWLEEQGKVAGQRSGHRAFGLEHMEGFAELADALRAVDIIRPRGVVRFHTFEEADAWWTASTVIRPRPAGRPPSGI